MLTLGIAILLASGLAAAKLCQKFKLPSVSGYILAGLLLGPTGFEIISEKTIGHNLDHFTQIALMLIAFGIGEHIEIRKLEKHAKSLFFIGICETSGAFIAVTSCVYGVISLTSFHVEGWQSIDYLAFSILLGAVSVATAPAATLLVIREMRAKGPLTSTLMAIVAIDDGLAIMIFGMAIAMTQHLLGHTGEAFYISFFSGIFEIVISVILGVAAGYIIRIVTQTIDDNSELMIAGLAILLLCGEIAIIFNLSPLLAGMAAGFTLVNKADRNVKTFRALNQFEPPIYILFFTLAGTHLDISSLGAAGAIGLIYFLARIGGKIIGSSLGARLAKSNDNVRKYLGFALVPQAGVAIGLIFLISSNPAFDQYSEIITQVVLAGVFISELIGPLAARYAVVHAGEVGGITAEATEPEEDRFLRSEQGVKIVPWTWKRLTPARDSKDIVVFGAANSHTVKGLARFATILAHYFGATPMSVRVNATVKQLGQEAFSREREEVSTIGYKLITEHVPDKQIASGLVAATEYNNARAIVLGFPVERDTINFQKVLETVIDNVMCPVVVVRFYGLLHTERILVPVTDMEDLAEAYQIICALNSVGEHQVEILYMMSSTAIQKDIEQTSSEIVDWLAEQEEQVDIVIKAIPTASRVDIICKEAEEYDLVVMGATRTRGVNRFLFGSLVDAISEKLRKPLLIVYNTDKKTFI